ncbi:MogA/MoaB family molybdenum cofactor biosynthesis protein [Candidatus Bathyarchaeota archaeon]|nr:MogA/MoaB family molybdenum cofactor biosynthesis protein [Candidatus Bathyarchaeota archaeon]
MKHKIEAPAKLNFAIITCSTSRHQRLQQGESASDPSGDIIVKLLDQAGHKVAFRRIVPDDRALITEAVKDALSRKEIDAVITCGGTGIAPTDITVETVRELLEKELPGFGEILRRISYDQIGSSAVLTRALAGTIEGKAVFCLPGSPQAVETALKYLIIPESGHIIKHAREKA